MRGISKRNGIIPIVAAILLALVIGVFSIPHTETEARAEASGLWTADGVREEFTLRNVAQPNSESNPYIIDTPGKLGYLAAGVLGLLPATSSNIYAGAYFLQTCDVDMGDHWFIPIGMYGGSVSGVVGAKPFGGIYDGGGFAVKNVWLYTTQLDSRLTVTDGIGVFGFVSGVGSIKNLSVTSAAEAYVSGVGSNIGSLVGMFSGNIITDCSADFDMEIDGAASYVGGIVGRNLGNAISNTYFTGAITAASATYFGGIAGGNGETSISKTHEISSCFNAGALEGSGATKVGGIAGQNMKKITDCFNVGAISCNGIVGGIVGVNENNGTVSRVYNTGSVTAISKKASVVGDYKTGTVSEGYYLTEDSEGIIDIPAFLADIGVNTDKVSVKGKSYLDFVSGVVSFTGAAFKQNLNRTDSVGYSPYLMDESKAYTGIPLFAGYISDNWGGEEHPFVIKTVDQFRVMRESVTGGMSYAGKYLRLNNGLNFTSYYSVGTLAAPFSGSFDGNGYAVNSAIVVEQQTDGIGLFGVTVGASFKNLTLNNIHVESAMSDAGILVGIASDTDFSNVSVGDDCVVIGNNNVGGIAGKIDLSVGNCTVTKCFSSATVEAYGNAGGLIGSTTGNNAVTISLSSHSGNVEGDTVGGIIGQADGAAVLSYCANVGSLTGDAACGGLVGGGIAATTIEYSFNNADVVGKTHVGGLIGISESGVLTVAGSYCVGDVVGDTDVCGLAGRIVSGTANISDSYFAGDIMGEGDTVAVGTATLTDCYFNSDLLTGNVTQSGTARNSYEMTTLAIGALATTANTYAVGYYPQAPDYVNGDLEEIGEYLVSLSLESVTCRYFNEGNGSSALPYTISTEAQLLTFTRFINEGTAEGYYNNKNYALTANINATREYSPIGNSEHPFAGSFNGKNFVVCGVKIDASTEDNAGFFGYVTSGTIQKLHLIPDGVEGYVRGRDNVGGIVGYSGGSVVSCSNRVSVNGRNNVGGIAGNALNVIRLCFNVANVDGTDNVGGLAGRSNFGILRSFNSGYVHGSNAVGGLLGISADASVTYSYNSGIVHGETYVGGIIGDSSGSASQSISGCYSIGDMAGNTYVGTIVGRYTNTGANAKITYCYYNNDTIKEVSALIGGGETAKIDSYSGALATMDMIANGFVTETYFPEYANYAVTGARSDIADYAPQITEFKNMTVEPTENPDAVALVKKYSLESAMLRLFGQEVGNAYEWGTEENPYLLENLSHILIFAQQVNDNSYQYEGKTFKLTTDLTLPDTFTPIGRYYAGSSDSIVFSGNFDGNGHTVSGFAFNGTGVSFSVGFFSAISANSVLKNLHLDDTCVFIGSDNVGSFVGSCRGKVYRCFSEGSVQGNRKVGGIVGELFGMSNAQIDSCLFSGQIRGEQATTTGGVCGNVTTSFSYNFAYNSWFVRHKTVATFSGNIYDSILEIDKGTITGENGDAAAQLNFFADDDEVIQFNVAPSGGFRYTVMNEIDNRAVSFSTPNDGTCFPMKATGYNGTGVKWGIHFTKEVTIGTITRGTASGAGWYYEGQRVSIAVSPYMGYRLELEPQYGYSGDGENIACYWVMGNESVTFNAVCTTFGTDTTAPEIKAPDGTAVATVVAPDGSTSTSIPEYEYSGLNMVYTINLSGLGCEVTYARMVNGGQEVVAEAKVASTYRVTVRAIQQRQGENIIVGRKVMDFVITPRRLTVDVSAIAGNSLYTEKEYNNDPSDTVTFAKEFITLFNPLHAGYIELLAADDVEIRATRTFYNGDSPDASVDVNKTVRFTSFVLTGSAATSYYAPEDIILYEGSPIEGVITKIQATVRLTDATLNKQYDGEIPSINYSEIEKGMSVDNLRISEYSYLLVNAETHQPILDEEGHQILDGNGWQVGTYLIGIKTISGNSENYDIDIEEAYFVIERKRISSVIFSGHEGLRYTNTDYAESITARFTPDGGTSYRLCEVGFTKNNVAVATCVSAGQYIATATIADGNFLLDPTHSSIAFSVSKVEQAPLTIASVGSTLYYNTQKVDLTLSAEGSGDGAVVYELLGGKARLTGSELAFFGSGEISVRARKSESENYYMTYSPILRFVVKKSVLQAKLPSSITVVYGDTPRYEVAYFDGNNEVERAQISGLIEPSVKLSADELVVNADGYDVSLNDDGYADGYIIDVSASSAVLTVLRKTIRVDAIAATKLYGDEDPVFAYTVSDESATLNGRLQRMVGENSGEYLLTQGTLTEEQNPNYKITFIPAVFSIEKRQLRVTVDNVGKFYGQPDPAFTYTVNIDDLRLTDTIGIVSGTFIRDVGENVGLYEIRGNGPVTAGGNYTVRLTTGVLSIKQATPEVRGYPVTSEITYGDTLFDSVITGTMSIPGRFVWNTADTMLNVLNSERTEYEALFVPTDTVNYADFAFNLTVRVNKRKSIVRYIGESAYVYDGTPKKLLDAALTNVVAGDEPTVILSYEPVTNDDDKIVSAGKYLVTATVSDENYDVDAATLTKEIEIIRKELTVKIENATIAEGDNFTPVITYSGFVGLDSVDSLTKKATASYSDELKGGTTVKMTPGGATAENYSFMYVDGTLTIKLKAIGDGTVTVNGDGLGSDATVTSSAYEKSTAAFSNMKSYIEKNIDEQFKELTLGSYVSVTVEGSVSGSLEYRVKMAELADNTPVIVHKKDGTVTLLSDYKYENGELIFTAENVDGVGTLTEKSFIEQNKQLLIYVGIGVGGAALLVIVILLIVGGTKKSKRNAIRYKD